MARATLAVLFSDIEGSTRLLQELGAGYADVLLQHRRLLRAAFDAHEGTERGTEGDSFFVTFPTARDAVAAALGAQLAVSEHVWPSAEATVRVRMGVHVGEVEDLGDTVVGMVIHQTARIASAGHGGQVLVSASAAQLTQPMPDGASWHDLGEHRVKDVPEPIHFMQLAHAGLRPDLPPLRLRGSVRNNLPQQSSTFIGRESEVAAVRALLGDARLVTLTGSGGVGKTRIALRVAADHMERFTDGVFLVDLAQVTEPGAVVNQFATAIGLGDSTLAELVESLDERRVLFVVDNCEHVLASAADAVHELLAQTSGVAVLATSREPLGLAGELVWRVPPLSADDARGLIDARAHAANAAFAITDQNRAAVDEVCQRLDAIPLALELAAARLGSLTIEQVAQRLDQRFRLLAGGARGSMERHRTLQATVDWSYDHLDPDEQALLRRLGVFVGGFPLDGAEAVSGLDDPLDVLDLIDRLVAKSLVIADTGGEVARYRLLETIRHYAMDRLAQTPDAVAVREAHVDWVVAMATDADRVLWHGGDESSWMRRLDLELGNVRAALDWSTSTDPAKSIAILAGLDRWLSGRGRAREGLEWCQAVIATGVTGADLAQARLEELFYASNAGPIPPEIVAATRDCADLLPVAPKAWLRPMARAYVAAWSYPSGDVAGAQAAISVCEQAYAEGAGMSPVVRALLIQPLVWVNLDSERLTVARDWAERGLADAIAGGSSVAQSRLALNCARVAAAQGESEVADARARQAMTLARSTGDFFVAQVATRLAADLAEQRGEYATARDLLSSVLDDVAETQSAEEMARVRADLLRNSRRAAEATG